MNQPIKTFGCHIEGNPPTQTHQARLRAFKIGAHCRIVKVKPDAKTVAFQRELAAQVKEWKRHANASILFPEGAVKVLIAFYFPAPKCARFSSTVTVPKTTRPDLDNLVKNVLDALTDAGAWADDSQISTLHIKKRISIHPITIIHLSSDE